MMNDTQPEALQDSDLKNLINACAQLERTMTIELREMARFQPPRFVDLCQAVDDIVSTSVSDVDMTDEQYELTYVASMLTRSIGCIPKRTISQSYKQAELNRT
jgi:hypothetical protein